MKTIYKSLRNISLALCATMAISSCDSFLDTKPYDFVAPTNVLYKRIGMYNGFGRSLLHTSLRTNLW